MTDLEQAILGAWQRIRPTLLADAAELSRRLARRRTPTLLRPPRAWCLAVRASDTRINPATAAIVPEHALSLDSHLHPYRFGDHEVIVDVPLLGRLCGPVRIEPPGEEWHVVARKLGVHEEVLRRAIRLRALEVRYVKYFEARPGKPVPFLYSPEAFDPSAGGNFWRVCDPIWGTTWQHLPDMLPPHFEQPLIRKPHYQPYRGFDEPRFRGWRWECPGCRREVRTLFCPLPPINLPRMLHEPPPLSRRSDGVIVRESGKVEFADRSRRARRRARWQPDENDPDAIQPPPLTFGCVRCHRVRYFSRVNKNSWNELIAYLTSGLLYGSEVTKPDWFKPRRLRFPRRQLLRAPSARRQQVLEGLLRNQKYREIARALGVGYATVHGHVKDIYRQHGAHSRIALAKQLKRRLPPRVKAPKREEVRQRLAAGESRDQIAAAMEISDVAVHHHLKAIRRENRRPTSIAARPTSVAVRR
jgi:DNA-binding CsgD family transcriptional regulator